MFCPENFYSKNSDSIINSPYYIMSRLLSSAKTEAYTRLYIDLKFKYINKNKLDSNKLIFSEIIPRIISQPLQSNAVNHCVPGTRLPVRGHGQKASGLAKSAADV